MTQPAAKPQATLPATAHSTGGAAANAASKVSIEPTERNAAELARDRALAPKIESILDAFANFSGRISPDGKLLLFQSNRGGVAEIFVADVGKPEAGAKKVVAGPERTDSAFWSRDGKWILFRRDQGADENFRIFRTKPDGSGLASLTPGEAMHRDEPLLPRKKPDTLVFTARRTSSPETFVQVASLSGGEPKRVLTDPGPSFGAAISADGTHALLLRFVSPTNQLVFDVDLANGASKRVYPPDGKSAGISAVEYASDGKRILLATDEGGEGNVVLALDAMTFRESARWVQDNPKTARVESMIVSPRGDRLVVAIDAGNHSELRILDARTLKLQRDVKIPLGAALLGDFSDDGKRFTLTESVPDTPPDVYTVDAASGLIQRLRNEPRPGVSDLPSLEVSLTAIPAHDGLSIPIHYYLPKKRDPSARLPVIVHFHGGPAASSRIGWNWMARFFTSQGFAFVEPNIRGSTGFGRAYEMADNREKRADALKDLETVNRWARTQSWADPERLVIYGGSYGGYLVLMGLTRQPKIWRAGVDFVGVANLFTFLKSTDQAIRSAFVEEFGDLEKDQKLLEEFSPMRDKEKIVAPLFIYQGQNDPRVRRSESDQVVQSLRTRRVAVEYMVAPNEGHSIDRRENRVEFLTRATRFLRDHF